MAQFGWAYINCGTLGGAYGPTGSVQFMSGSNDTTGTLNFMYHTAAYAAYEPNTLVVTGTLVISGTITASHYHIENVTQIDSTGSTYFGNTNDDIHVRTGSLYIGRSTSTPLFSVEAEDQQILFAAPLSASSTLHAVGAATFSSTIAASSSVTAGTSFIIGSADLNETDLEKLDGITDGTAAANKAVVLDASKNIATIGTLGCGAITSTGASTYGGLSGGAISGSDTLHIVGAATFSSTIAASSSISASAFYDTTLGTAINVTGVDSATDRSLIVANGTSGKAITGSIVTMDAAGNIDAGPTTIQALKFAAGPSGVTSIGPISGSSTLHAVGAATFSSTIAATGSVTAGSSFIIGSADLNETDLEKLDGITDGTAAGNKAVVLDASKNIATIGTLGCGAITSTGASTYGSLSGGAFSGSTTVQGGDATFSTLHLSGSGETEALRIGKGVSDTKEIVFENAGTDVASIFMNAAETLIIKNESNNDDIQFQTKPGGAATTVMTLDGISAGVGIGTVDPLTKLDVRWDPTGLADDTGGGDVVLFGSGTLTAGKLYYLHTDGAWTEVDADAVATGADQLLGIALGSDPTSDGVLIKGFFDATTYVSNFSKGKAIYVSTTAASMDTTAPSATGDFVRIVGYCTDTANVIYFNPSSEWIELA